MAIVKQENAPCDASSVKFFQEYDKKNFAKIFPDCDIESKYILWVRPTAFIDFTRSANIECKVMIHFHDELESVERTLRVRTPFPNKLWKVGCMTNGQKVNDIGFFLPFDTFEDLAKVRAVSVAWQINEAFTGGDDYCVGLMIPVTFEKSEENKNYSLEIKMPTFAIDILNAQKEDEGVESPDNTHSTEDLDQYNAVYFFWPDKETRKVMTLCYMGEEHPLAPYAVLSQTPLCAIPDLNLSKTLIELCRFEPQHLTATPYSFCFYYIP